MLSIKNEWLDKWCENINKKYSISSAYATDECVAIALKPTNESRIIFEENIADKIIKRLMPDELFTHMIANSLVLKCGSTQFIRTEDNSGITIGYIITLSGE